VVEVALKKVTTLRLHAAAVVLARAVQRVGASGCLGLVLMAAAAVVVGVERGLEPVVHDLPTPAARVTPTMGGVQSPRLPPQSELPVLLTRMQRAAVAQGLAWPKADYRVTPATDDQPAALDVRLTLEGPYLAVRQFVAALLLDAPTLTFRDLSVTRPSADAPTVEAQVAIVVFMAPDPEWSRRGVAR
jgi:hypothetical protein